MTVDSFHKLKASQQTKHRIQGYATNKDDTRGKRLKKTVESPGGP